MRKETLQHEHNVEGTVEAFGYAETPHSGVRFPVILLAFCIIATIAFAIVAVTEMRGVSTTFAEDGRSGLRLEALRGDIRYLDEAMSMSAQMAASTGDPAWETRYHKLDADLDRTLDETIKLGSSTFHDDMIEQLIKSKSSLLSMTQRAFALVRAGKLKDAKALLNSTDYLRERQIYASGVSIFSAAVHQMSIAQEAHESRQSRFTYAAMLLVASILVGGTALMFRLAKWHRSLLRRVNHERERSSAVLESISDAFFSVDKHWCFLYANKRARGILKVSVEPQLGETLWRTKIADGKSFE